ncbi:MAG: SPOR domain-containing protein [Myxococcales bacterium]|nr:SPOR domain-containing protein [Myxococcales bacterium]MCB9627894.1 SPOR domain-containing protein [Sandaracinaceae bacterium]
MDTAMRNLEQIQETEPDDGSSRRLGMLAMAALATVMLVFAMGTMLQAGADDPAEAEDPLAALDRAAGTQLRAEEAAEPDVRVDARALRFHETLSATPSGADDRPEVEAALAAAAAELNYPDPLPGVPAAMAQMPAGLGVMDSDTVMQALPAAVAASPDSGDLSLAMGGDPMVAAALPAVARQREPRVRASAGSDGLYTLQVISYRTREEAEIFAEALRGRGHQSFVTEAEVGDRGTFFRVRIGPFENAREAARYRATFEQEEQMNTYVVRRRDEA